MFDVSKSGSTSIPKLTMFGQPTAFFSPTASPHSHFFSTSSRILISKLEKLNQVAHDVNPGRIFVFHLFSLFHLYLAASLLFTCVFFFELQRIPLQYSQEHPDTRPVYCLGDHHAHFFYSGDQLCALNAHPSLLSPNPPVYCSLASRCC